MSERKILVTAALPYANGHIHLGHLVEYIQTDIWMRFQKLRGNRCIFLCADDTHGTAIMIRARQEGRSEEALIAEMKQAHEKDFAGFDIQFDNYGSTNSAYNERLCRAIWKSLEDFETGGVRGRLIVGRSVTQLYDSKENVFLADRFVKGTCPKCGSPDQYGDNCEKCGATYSPAELKDPVSGLSGTTPVLRDSFHYFVVLDELRTFLADWVNSGDHLQPEVANYLRGHFLGDQLRDWDVSRPSPYFGFPINGFENAPDNEKQYWYVWFDAPIGYIASLAEHCEKNGEQFDEWWPRGDDANERGPEIHHFIGKDITYFHTLFWPAMLYAAKFKLPTRVHIHGFLTVGGEKMSKRKGTFVQARTYLEHLDPAFLRYYYASKLSSKLDDLDLNLDEFVSRVNSDLVGKVVNLASRTARFVQDEGLSPRRVFEMAARDVDAVSSHQLVSLIPAYGEAADLFKENAAAGEEIAHSYEAGDYGAVVRRVMQIADAANRFIDAHPPWDKTITPGLRQDFCTIVLNFFRQITVYLSPILPKLAEQTATLLNLPPLEKWNWHDAQQPLPEGGK